MTLKLFTIILGISKLSVPNIVKMIKVKRYNIIGPKCVWELCFISKKIGEGIRFDFLMVSSICPCYLLISPHPLLFPFILRRNLGRKRKKRKKKARRGRYIPVVTNPDNGTKQLAIKPLRRWWDGGRGISSVPSVVHVEGKQNKTKMRRGEDSRGKNKRKNVERNSTLYYLPRRTRIQRPW